jgi:hypothetical protein
MTEKIFNIFINNLASHHTHFIGFFLNSKQMEPKQQHTGSKPEIGDGFATSIVPSPTVTITGIVIVAAGIVVAVTSHHLP